MHDEHVCCAGFVRHGSLYENWAWIVERNGEIRIGKILSFFMVEVGNLVGIQEIYWFFIQFFLLCCSFSFYDRFRYIDRLNLLAVALLVYPALYLLYPPARIIVMNQVSILLN